MLNDVIFNNEKSAYKDWNIVLTKAEIPPPTPKLMSINIMGADGEIDLSEVLTDDIKFDNRIIKLTFEVMDDTDYYSITSEMAKYLHGKNVKFRLNSNDDDYYYTGRAIINSWECVKRKGTIVLLINADPYKYNITETIYNVTLNNETKTIVLINGRKHLCPILDVTGSVKLNWEGKSYNLSEGKQQVLGFVLKEGNNTASFTGTGKVKITYRRGEL